MNQFEEPKMWQKAMDIADKVYMLSTAFSREEKYGLTRQIRRSAVSDASDIAEGAGNNTRVEFKNFLGKASGSANELYPQLVLSHRLKLVHQDQVTPVSSNAKEVQKMNDTLVKSLENNYVQ